MMRGIIHETIENYITQYIKNFKPYKGGKWCYEDGIVLLGAWFLFEVTGENKWLEFVESYMNERIGPGGQPEGYELEQYNIDNINPARVLYELNRVRGKDRYAGALELFYRQLATHPRTECGNFWHKKRYPFQIWLDGLYMAQPFYSRYIKDTGKTGDFSDVINQFKMVRKYLFHEEKKLYTHAYDESGEMPWADKDTGQSPNIWLRSVGWYAMALVDVSGIIGDHRITDILISYINELAEGMIVHQTIQGGWYQVVDQPSVADNYTETSGTLMISYALLKGVRLGYLPEDFRFRGITAFYGTLSKYLRKSGSSLHLGGTCQVAGLDDKGRDGSVEYYLSEPVVEDEAKGVAPLMMAFSEILRL